MKPLGGRIVLAALLGALAAPGCLVVALHPAYDEASIVFDETLLGVWVDEEDTKRLTLEPGQWRSYDVSYRDGSTDLLATGYLTAIGQARVLDLTTRSGEDAGPLLVPVHLPLRLRRHDDTLTVEALSYDWVQRQMQGGTAASRHFVREARDMVVFTGSTAALRRWLAVRLSQPDAFDVPATFRRAADASRKEIRNRP